jgi:hypothetical protein
MKPDSEQQLSRRAAFGADTLLGRHRKHSNQANRHINEKNEFKQQIYTGDSAQTPRDADITFISLVPTHNAGTPSKMEIHTLCRLGVKGTE